MSRDSHGIQIRLLFLLLSKESQSKWVDWFWTTGQFDPTLLRAVDRINDDDVEATTIRALLGDGFFNDLQKLKVRGAERIVFWFDN
jgi:hypothetical protein